MATSNPSGRKMGLCPQWQAFRTKRFPRRLVPVSSILKHGIAPPVDIHATFGILSDCQRRFTQDVSAKLLTWSVKNIKTKDITVPQSIAALVM